MPCIAWQSLARLADFVACVQLRCDSDTVIIGPAVAGGQMVARTSTVAFQGIEVLDIDVQVHVASGLPAFTIVGLPDKAVGESRERVRSAIAAIGIGLPPKRITVNLAPADVVKEGSHFDLPIALALLAAMGVLPQSDLSGYTVLGELALDGAVTRVNGVLPAAIDASGRDRGLICPASQGQEAVWAGDLEVIAAENLLAVINHFKGHQVVAALARPAAGKPEVPSGRDLAEIKGQETAKRALEVAAAGGHNLLMVGPPGAGKSMLAQCLPGILPPLSPQEALGVSLVHSLAGTLPEDGLVRQRPFRDPHHSCSVAALVGGGTKANPGEVSLAHMGTLFLDELPEFARGALEALRQPIESGRAVVARANRHVTYPARFQLVAAMNPCRCGYLGDAELACSRAPRCANDYQGKISGPMFDRIDIHTVVPAVSAADLGLPPPSEDSATVAARVAFARAIQAERYGDAGIATNAEADGAVLEGAATPDDDGKALLVEAADKMRLSARGYHRVLRVARTLADLAGKQTVARMHIAEALSYRRMQPGLGT